MASLLRDARDHGIPEAFSRVTQWRVRKVDSRVKTPFGPLVQEVKIPLSSGSHSLSVQHPLAMLHTAVARCGPFSELMRATLARHPPSDAPWRLALYSDEIGQSPIEA